MKDHTEGGKDSSLGLRLPRKVTGGTKSNSIKVIFKKRTIIYPFLQLPTKDIFKASTGFRTFRICVQEHMNFID